MIGTGEMYLFSKAWNINTFCLMDEEERERGKRESWRVVVVVSRRYVM